MHTLARVCVQRPVFAAVVSLTLLVVGLAGYLKLGVDRFPNIDAPMVSISTAYPGASAKEVESAVTDRIERRVNNIGGIDTLSSTSSDGLSMITIRFQMNKSVTVAAEEVRTKVSLAEADLPPDSEKPVVSKFDATSIAVISYAVSSGRPLRDTYEYVDKQIRRKIESVNGVGEVSIIGGRKRQINVVVDPYRLRSFGLTTRDISTALGQQNVQTPGGLLEGGRSEMTLRTEGRLARVADFERVVLRSTESRPVLLADVAKVEDGESRAQSVASIDGREAVVIEVIKQSGTNSVAVVDQIKRRIEEIRRDLPGDMKLSLISDDSVFVRASVKAVREHLVVGAILAAVVVLLFLRDVRSTVIAALAIPLSVIATFAFMRGMGFTQNMITLLALTLSVGIVIDDAIVVLENIHRVIVDKRLSPHDAAVEATREIGLAVVAITLSLVAVFLPVAFMGGIMGRILNSFGLVMAAAIALSMFVSFSLTPMLCSRWLRPAASSAGHAESESRWYRVVDASYTALLRWALAHRPAVWLLCGALIVSSVPLLMVANKNFMVDDDESQFGIQVRAAEGTSLESTRTLCERVAEDARRLPEVALVMVKVASDSQQTRNKGVVFVKLREVEQRSDRSVTQQSCMTRARDTLVAKYAEQGIRLSVRKQSAIGGSEADAQIAVTGRDLDQLARYSQQAVARCSALEGVADVESTLEMAKPELVAQLDRTRAGDLGVNVTDAAQVLRLAVSGDDKITDYEENGEQYEVHMRLGPRYRTDGDGLNLLDLPSTNAPGGVVELSQVVAFGQRLGMAQVDRYNRQRQFTLSVNLKSGAALGAVSSAVSQALADMHMAEGYSYGYTGRSGDMDETFQNFIMAFALSAVFMYLVIAAQFESFQQAVAIMLILPLTVPFALVSIVLTGDSLNIMSLLGMLVLLGVVKKNSILQVDRANQLREQGMELEPAAIQAARDRLRPILMTTIAFVAGMVPLIAARGTGAATSHTTGSVIIGGQVLSLLVTLVAAPVFYVSIERRGRSGRRA